MEKSRLFAIVQSLTPRELREVRKWLRSPAHNRREDVQRLFEYLAGVGGVAHPRKLDKVRVFRQVFPGEAFDDARLRQTMHFLLKVLENYLTWKELTEDARSSKIALARTYRKRRLDKSCRKALQDAGALLEEESFRDERHLHHCFLFEEERYNYLSGFKRTELNLQEVSEALDTFFIAAKLRQACFMLAHQAVVKRAYDPGLLPAVLQYVENRQLLDIAPIAIYYHGYKALTEKESEEHFFHLKSQIARHGHQLPEEELRIVYLLAINYCISRMNAGQQRFLRETFEMLRRGLESKILIENNTLSRWTFLNAVVNGTLLKEFAWVENFIQEYQTYLEEKYRTNTVHYCRAKLFFEKGDYDRAQPLLVQYDFEDIVLNLNAKTMLLKIFYEENELDALDSLIASMRTYLQRKKVMGYHRENFLNFLTLTRKLAHLNPYDQPKREALRREIEAVHPMIVTDRQWLLKMVG